MKVDPEEIMQQIQGSIRALEKLPALDRRKTPGLDFGDDYNRLRRLAKESLPDVRVDRWPPEIIIQRTTKTGGFVHAYFVEIHAYLNQIAVILEQNIEPPEIDMG